MLTERETVEFVDRGQSSGFGAGGLPRLVKGGDVVFDVLFGYGVRFVDAAGFEPINVFGDVGFVGGDGGRGEPRSTPMWTRNCSVSLVNPLVIVPMVQRNPARKRGF